MHILFLTHNFPPEVNAPASRTFEHCREWVKAGHRVTVITCAPNAPYGRVYDGYKNRLWQSQSMDGIQVVRVWSYLAANAGFLRRVLNYASYSVASIVAAVGVRKVDIVVGTSPQFFAACAARVVSGMKGVPFIFELRDLWPESIKVVGAMKEGRIIRFLEHIELYLYKKAERVVSVTHSFKRALAERGVDDGKINVVTNGVDLAHFRPQPKDAALAGQYELEGKFVAGYIGTHGMAHALDTILDAAVRLRELDGDRFRFILIGDGAEKERLKQKSLDLGLLNVCFVDSVSKHEIVRYWSLLDASIIHLRKTKLFETVIPSKLFESMGMGIPILHGVAGESAEIVNRHRAGLTFQPENAAELCEKLIQLEQNPLLLEQLAMNSRKAAPKYERSYLARQMLSVLEEAVGHTSAPSSNVSKGKEV